MTLNHFDVSLDIGYLHVKTFASEVNRQFFKAMNSKLNRKGLAISFLIEIIDRYPKIFMIRCPKI